MREPEQVPNPVAYACLLFTQTAAACVLFWMAFPIVYHLVTQLGERQDLAMFDQNVIVFSAAVVHGMVLGATALGAG